MRRRRKSILNNQHGGSVIGILGAIVGGVVGYVYGGPYGAFQGAMWGYGLGSIAEVFVTGFPSPDLSSLGDASATYAGSSPVDTIREGIPIARAYGRCQLAGNKVRTNDVNTETTMKVIITHCVGPVSGVISYEVNDIAWASLVDTNSYNFYSGTTSQTYDSRFIGDSFGSEIITSPSCALDFFDDVTAPWYYDAVGEQYNINGSQAAGVSMSLFSSGVTKNHYYRIVSTLGNYEAGYLRFGFGGGVSTSWYSGNTTTSIDIFCNGTDSNFYTEADADCSASLQYLSLRTSTGRNSAYRGVAYSAFTFAKNNQIGWNPNITTVGDWLLCTPIGEVVSGGSDKIFSRNPAVVQYDWYINVEGYTYNEMNIAEFRSLEDFCNAIDATSGTSRYTFDYVFDTTITINDAKKLIWQSFNGACVLDQGLIKPVWESAKATVSFAFTPRNIVRGSFTWSRPRVPNVFRVYYIDGDSKWEKTFIELKNEESIKIRGEIIHEENCWFINNQYTARKRAQFVKDKAESMDFTCKLSSFSSAGALEIYDRVTVTHPLPAWDAKDFIIKSISEDALGRPTFYLESFYAGIYHGEPAVVQSNYASYLSDPFATPGSVTGISLVEGGFIAQDGTYVPYISTSFTKPTNSIGWITGQVWLSTNGTNYSYYQSAVSGTTVESGGGVFAEGDTVYVKILSENDRGVVEAIASVSATSITVLGKMALPSDPKSFQVVQNVDAIIFSVDRPSLLTDADFSHFELREGTSWESSDLIATYTHTKYILLSYSSGAKTYLIKCVDTSGNKSLNAASKSITVSPSTGVGILKVWNLHKRLKAYSGVTNLYIDQDVNRFHILNEQTGTSVFADYTTGTAWYSAVSKAWSPAYSNATYLTEKLDYGSEISSSVYLDLGYTSYAGTGVSKEIRYSTDDITWTSFEIFESTNYTLRYLQFRINVVADMTYYPLNGLELTKMDVTLGNPIRTETGNDVVIGVNGVTVTFATEFTTVGSISVKLTGVSSGAVIPVTIRKATDTFFAMMYDINGNATPGLIDWTARGY